MAHIFISYAKADTRGLAVALYEALSAIPGITAWMDMSIEADSSWAGQIQREIDRSDYVVVLLSPDVNRVLDATTRRSFVLNEIDYAQQEYKPILPVMVLPTKVPVQLAGIQYINLVGNASNPEPIVARVCRRFGIEHDAPPPAQGFAARPRPPYGLIAGVGGAVVLVVVIALLLASNLNSGGQTPTAAVLAPTATPELAASPTSAAATPAPTEASPAVPLIAPTLSAAEVLAQALTGTHHADLTRTVQLVTETAAAAATGTAQDALRRTLDNETRAAATLTAFTFTDTPTATQTPSKTPTLTVTPSLTPTPDPLVLAANFTGANDDWTPVSRVDARGVTMMLVPAGSFEMGSTAPEIDAAFALCQAAADNGAECQRSWFDDELIPAAGNRQTVAPFWIDQTEVTRAQYDDCVAALAEGCTAEDPNDFSSDPVQPINYVNWEQATAYCAWRGGRLPTEAEWEFAARGPDRLVFPWGNTFDGQRANHCDGNCGAASWASGYDYVNQENDDGYAVTAPVGSYDEGARDGASWVGALDMAGNLWEWTSSAYEPYPYRADDGREVMSNEQARVVRGGSFYNPSNDLRAASRDVRTPTNGNYGLGFRCALSPERSEG